VLPSTRDSTRHVHQVEKKHRPPAILNYCVPDYRPRSDISSSRRETFALARDAPVQLVATVARRRASSKHFFLGFWGGATLLPEARSDHPLDGTKSVCGNHLALARRLLGLASSLLLAISVHALSESVRGQRAGSTLLCWEWLFLFQSSKADLACQDAQRSGIVSIQVLPILCCPFLWLKMGLSSQQPIYRFAELSADCQEHCLRQRNRKLEIPSHLAGCCQAGEGKGQCIDGSVN
jgi:hypothetical protein